MELIKEKTKTIDSFKKDIEEGLSKFPKAISSKYFYDKKGDKLFQEIMNLEEYYLTDCEFDIFVKQKGELLKAINPDKEGFNLIELGAGDGSKTKILIEHFLYENIDFSYHPVDISNNILGDLKKDLQKDFPKLKIDPINKEYFSALKHLNQLNGRKNVILFLGSNIGNFDSETRNNFFSSLSMCCSTDDQFILGVDLKKDPSIILKAYSDSQGVTAKFNLNLLTRINNELGGNFDLSNFKHYASYNPENGEARSYIVSLKDQEVYISAIDKTIVFLKSEYMHTEISKKYNLSELNEMANDYGFSVTKHFMDENEYFVDSLWTLKQKV